MITLRPAWRAPPDFVRVGPGVRPPKLIYRADPEYSPDARAARLQGTVVFEAIIDELGKTTNINTTGHLDATFVR